MSDTGDKENSYNFKIITLGDPSVGKTSVVIRAVNDEFKEDVQSTIGNDRFNLTTSVSDANVHLTIFDTAGQENFGSFSDFLFNQADVFLVFYAVDDTNSFNSVENWVNIIKNSKYTNNSNYLIYLIENKIDLRSESTILQLTTEQGERKAAAIEAKFESVSAKSGQNVQKLIEDISKDCLKLLDNNVSKTNVVLIPQEKGDKKNCC